MKKVVFTLFLALGLMSSAFAQNEEAPVATAHGSHVGFGFTTGWATASPALNDFAKDAKLTNDGYGWGLGGLIEYSYIFGNHVGIRTGVGLMGFHDSYKVETATFKMDAVDGGVWGPIDYTFHVKDASLNFNPIYLNVPLQLALKFDHWFLNVGFKFAFLVKPEITVDFNDVDVAAYLQKTGNFITGDKAVAPVFGCGHHEADVNMISDKKFHMLYILSLDGGWRFKAGDGNFFELGAYIDYSLNKIDITSPQIANVTYRNDVAQIEINPLASAFSYLSAGIKFSYNFSVNDYKTAQLNK